MDQTYDPAKRAKETQKARERDEQDFAGAATEQCPRSVVSLHTQAQISHRNVAAATELLDALQRPDTLEPRAIAAQALQEAEIRQFAELLVDRVVNGLELPQMLSDLSRPGAIRRPDLVDW